MPSAIFNPVLIHSSVFPSPSGKGIAAHSIRCYLSLMRGNFGKLAQWRNLSMAADNPVNLDVCIIDAGKERDRVFNAQSIRRIDGAPGLKRSAPEQNLFFRRLTLHNSG